jgi:hypothetical protein
MSTGWSDLPCLRLVEAFADGEQLLEVVARHRLKGIVSKRKVSPPTARARAAIGGRSKRQAARSQPRTLAPVRSHAVMRRRQDP